jgi:hypothetical protein
VVNANKVTPIEHQEFSEQIGVFNSVSVEQWNDRDLEEFCRNYTEDAVMVTSAGIFKGREAILQAYLTAYPDRSLMGIISVEVVDIRFPPDDRYDDDSEDLLASMATAVIHCVVTVDGIVTEDCYSMVTFVLDHEGDMYIAQDTSN